MDIEELYSEELMALAGTLPIVERLADPDASATRVSRICGSRISVDLKLADGRVSDYGHDIRACAVGQAAASVLTRHVIGAAPDELRAVRTQLLAMLKAGDPPPMGKWAALAALAPVRDFPQRHGAAMLVFEAVADALDLVENGDSGK